MKRTRSLVEHLAPDTIRQLEIAAKKRYDDAVKLLKEKRLLMAIYLFGYCAEMCLGAAYFRSTGFRDTQEINADIRNLRMAQARGLKLMNKDPHPLVGWARFLSHVRHASGKISPSQRQRLNEATNKAETIYRHWRPELRYKSAQANLEQADEVRKAASWFIANQKRL